MRGVNSGRKCDEEALLASQKEIRGWDSGCTLRLLSFFYPQVTDFSAEGGKFWMHNVHFSFSFIFSSLHPAFSPCGLQSSLQPARKKLQPARHRLQPARKRLQPFKKRRKSLQPSRKKFQPVRLQFQPGGKNSAGGTQDGSGWIRMHIVHVSFSSCSY